MLNKRFLNVAFAVWLCVSFCFLGCDEPVEMDVDKVPPTPSISTPDDSASRGYKAEPIKKSESVATDDGHEMVANPSAPFALKFLAWNVESDGSNPATIAKQLSAFKGYNVIALTEVLPAAAASYREAFGDDYNYILSDSGRNDRLMLIYNKKALKFVRKFELADINEKSRYRSPLVTQLRDIVTGRELLVMVNHLARGNEQVRQNQAKKLVAWARDQTLPIVSLGDYNFDYVFDTRQGNESFRLFMKDSIWKWVEPSELIDTNWYDNPEEPDGKDDYPGSMLDFAFVAGPAKDWRTSCRILVRDNDFPDDDQTSDHRPYELIISAQ